jgi:hypothetical protein
MRFVADENFSGHVTEGVRRRWPSTDIVRVQDVGLSGASDEAILEWAAQQQRLVLTHDVSTMTAHAYARVRNGRPMPGVIEVPRRVGTSRAIEELLLIIQCSLEREWENQVIFVPIQPLR